MRKITILIVFQLAFVSILQGQTTIEAEDCTLGPNCHVREDYYVGIYGSGGVGWIGFPWQESGSYKVMVVARGQEFQGWPRMGVGLSPEEILDSVEVNSEDWQTYELSCDLPSGVDSLYIVFLNDYWIPGVGDRNLYVDKIIVQDTSEVPVVRGRITVEWDPPTEDEAGNPLTTDDLYGYRIYISQDPAGTFRRFGPEFIPPTATTYQDTFALEEGIWWLYMTAFRKVGGLCGLESKPSNLVSFEVKRLEEKPATLPPIIIRIEIKIGER